MKVLLTGSKGMLGQAFLKKKPEAWALSGVDIEALDLTKKMEVKVLVHDFQPDLVINCAAYTQVDDCEKEQAKAFAVNGTGVGYLAEAASSVGAKMVHFSTDYVFDGSGGPYSEEAPQAPINAYGASKQEGERQLTKHLDDYLLIRTQWLYGKGGKNFVSTILRLAENQTTLKVVDDQIGSPTWTEDLAEAVVNLVQKKASGAFHLVNQGICSWYQFACRIAEEAGLSAEIIACGAVDFPRPAKRPARAVLETAKASALLGQSLPSWEVALKRYMISI